MAAAQVEKLRGEIATRDQAVADLQAKIAEGEAARASLADQLADAKSRQDVWASRVVGANKSATVAAAEAQALRLWSSVVARSCISMLVTALLPIIHPCAACH